MQEQQSPHRYQSAKLQNETRSGVRKQCLRVGLEQISEDFEVAAIGVVTHQRDYEVGAVHPDQRRCQRRSKIRPQGGAKTGHFGFGRSARHEAAASQPRLPNSWRLTGRFGPSGPNLYRRDQAVSLDLRARL